MRGATKFFGQRMNRPLGREALVGKLLACLLTYVLLLSGIETAWADRIAAIPLPRRADPQLAREVDQAAETVLKAEQAVGYAVAVVKDGRIAYVGTYGFEDREAKVPTSRDTLFRWASISKTLTATAAMRLAQEGKLDLDADVRTLVPEFPDKGVPITARQLLCHQSGIVHYTNGRVIRTPRTDLSEHPFRNTIDALDTFKESPLIAAPGEKFSYSTHAYILLSAVVERAAGEPFAEYVERQIARPLGMKSLRPDYQWDPLPHRAKGYRKVAGFVVPSTDTDVSWKLGGGGYVSTIDDMARWAVASMDTKVVHAKTREAMWTRQQDASGKRTGFGLGYGVSGSGEMLRVSHSGAQEKTRSLMVCYPRLGVAAVAVTNSEYAKPGLVVDRLLPLLSDKLSQ